ncbi:hypothetical protein ILUMI_09027, partial [Ignelater luminosus]
MTRTPTTAKAIGRPAKRKRTAITQSKKSPIKLTSDEALASFVQTKLTKRQYVAIHTETKTHNAELLLTKKRCYPENITVTEVSTEIRVCASSGNSVNVRAIYKWQLNYEQRFVDSDHNHDDSFMFVVSCIPIRLVDENDTILWQNNRRSSTKFFRPIKIAFQRETEEMVQKEVAVIKHQISQLRPVEVATDSSVFVVHLTMIDGKIGGIFTEAGSESDDDQ